MPPLPPERRLVLAALPSASADAAALRRIAAEVRGWAALADAAARVGLEALVWDALAAAGVDGALPADAAGRLGAAAARTAAAAAAYVALAVEVQGELRGLGIEALPLKGVALCAACPAYAPLRGLSDLDLLVRPEALAAADRRLHEMGFEGGAAGVTVGGSVDLAPGRSRPGAHLPAYRRAGLVLELHERLPAAPGADVEPAEELWARAVAVPVRRGALTIPSREDQLEILCRHVLEHHARDPRMLPRHVADVHALGAVAVPPGRSAGPGRAAVVRSLELVEEARALADGADGARAPALALAFEDDLAARELAREALGAGAIVDAVRTSGWRAVFPAEAYMRAMAPVRGWSRWLPLAHAQRLASAAFRAVAGWARRG